MRRVSWIVAGALLCALGSCAGAPQARVESGPTYSCCISTDINRVYRPGDTLTIHWIVQGPPATGPAPAIALNAHLSGPSGSVTQLKGGAAASATFTAAPVHPVGATGEHPISTILIPATAGPGYYDLAWSIGGSGFSFSGDSIVQLEAGP